MKKSLILVASAVLSTVLIIGCSSSETKSPKKKITGTWKVEDVSFASESPMDSAQAAASRQSAKAVSYELLEDQTVRVHAGRTVLEGTWLYKQSESGVYMIFKGSADTVLLGSLQQGKLVNVVKRPDITITTIFTKEEN